MTRSSMIGRNLGYNAMYGLAGSLREQFRPCATYEVFHALWDNLQLDLRADIWANEFQHGVGQEIADDFWTTQGYWCEAH